MQSTLAGSVPGMDYSFAKNTEHQIKVYLLFNTKVPAKNLVHFFAGTLRSCYLQVMILVLKKQTAFTNPFEIHPGN
jgi:hypothetical protein